MGSVGKRFFLHAPNIHCGGGLTLFKALLKDLPAKTCLIVDKRLPIADEELSNFCVYRIKPKLWHRFMAERLLRRLSSKGDAVLCFGNLPPLFSLEARVSLFVQNRYLVESKYAGRVPLKLRFRLGIERLWLRSFQKNVEKVIVQTSSMKTLTSKYVKAPVFVMPFAESPKKYKAPCLQSSDMYDFIYVASGELHKNHKNLMQAWVNLAQEGVFPSLCLTINPETFPEMAEEVVGISKQHNLKVINVGKVGGSNTLKLYKAAKALIFPSELESFGLPLLEARAEGLKVVASELDYVRDILDPDETFDPQSATSIARAVKRLMNLEREPFALIDGGEIIKLVTSN